MKSLSNKALITIAATLVVAIGALLAMLISKNNDMDEMEEILTEQKNQLVDEYNELYTEYDGIRSDNDSLNGLLDEQRERVEQLSNELQTLKASSARRIKELQGELTTLRTVMRSFVVQIDSLDRKNKALTAENNEIRGQISRVAADNAILRENNESLTSKVNIASRLEAVNISVAGLNFKDREVSKAAKVAKIKTSFTLAKNVSATVGNVDVFVRITRPDGQLLLHSAQDKFRYEDSDVNFSAKRQVEYGGDDMPSYVVYDVDAGELMEGSYDVELFCRGEKIGSAKFAL